MRKLTRLFALCCCVVLSLVIAGPDQTLTLTRGSCRYVSTLNETEIDCHWQNTAATCTFNTSAFLNYLWYCSGEYWPQGATIQGSVVRRRGAAPIL
jgi:hypothetical protein